MHRWCPVMLNALSKSFTCSLILILILIVTGIVSGGGLVSRTRPQMLIRQMYYKKKEKACFAARPASLDLQRPCRARSLQAPFI